MHFVLPDVYGEAAVAGHWVLVRALQGDGGFGSSTDFTAEDYSLPERTHHVWQRDEELWSHCTQKTSQALAHSVGLRVTSLSTAWTTAEGAAEKGPEPTSPQALILIRMG